MENAKFYPESFQKIVELAEDSFDGFLDRIGLTAREWHRLTVSEADLDEDRRDDLMTLWGQYLDDYPPEYHEIPSEVASIAAQQVDSLYGNMSEEDREYKICEYVWREALEDAEDNLLERDILDKTF